MGTKKRKRNVYSQEFKDKVVKDFIDSPRIIRLVAEKYNISLTAVSNWVTAYIDKNKNY